MKNREELKSLTPEELQNRLDDAYEEHNNLLIQKSTHQISNPLRIRQVRREIARLKTFLRQHELNIAPTSNKSEK